MASGSLSAINPQQVSICFDHTMSGLECAVWQIRINGGSNKLLEPYKTAQKGPNQEAGLGNRGPLND